ncbi:MAG: hypothetical protein H8D47_05300 [Planctomycetes bacterium]|nr:hypothetical protein [Planctomycetota bacterium]MBL7107070.1 hypothetical protein [Phycisphaerae bacterium]
MSTTKDRSIFRFKIYTVIVSLVMVAGGILTVMSDIYQKPQADWIVQLSILLVALMLFMAVFLLSSKLQHKLNQIEENSQFLEKIVSTLEKNRNMLLQINQSTHLSEEVKSIVFRDSERQSIREAVFDKLQQKDFDTTYKMIDEVSKNTKYKELAGQLKIEADRYRDATDKERTAQIINHIDKLIENHQWAKASMHIERLIRSEPKSQEAKNIRRKLIEKKNERKRILLAAWDDAVKREDTDRSLEILKELDMYLTPNEGLALQEAARDIFKNKLHSLGVQFSLAVSEKDWTKALKAGEQITRDFPNSRMAQEISENIDALHNKAQRKKQQS